MSLPRIRVLASIVVAICLLCPSAWAKDKVMEKVIKELPDSVDSLLGSRFIDDPVESATKSIKSARKFAAGAKISPRTARDLAKVIRKHAISWADAGETSEAATELIEATDAFVKYAGRKLEDDPDILLATTHLSVATTLNQVAAGDATDAGGAFLAAAKTFAQVAEKKSSKKAYYLSEAAETLRLGSQYVDAKLKMLQDAETYLEQARAADAKSSTALAETGHNIAARARVLLLGGKKADARKLVQQGLDLLALEKGQKPKKRTAGAYNVLVELAMDNKLATKLDYMTKSSSAGTLDYEYPYGVGWAKSSGFFMEGSAILNRECSTPTGAMRIGVSTFDQGVFYVQGEGGAGADNVKGLLKSLKEIWTAKLSNPKARGISASGLGKWARKATGFHVQGENDKGKPTSVWVWTVKSSSGHKITYSIVAEVVGATPKKPPRQLAVILGSMKEQKKK